MKLKDFLSSKVRKEQKGVSLIMLVIAIAMIAIVASYAIFYSQNTTPEAKLARAYSSLKTVKDACGNAMMLIELNPNEYDEFYFFGDNIHQIHQDATALNEIAVDCGLSSSLDFSERTYLIKPAEIDEEEIILKNLELKGIQDTYIVDLEKDRYYVLDGIEYLDGTTLYEYRSIVSAYEMLVGSINNND